jgi:hypothetical protein
MKRIVDELIFRVFVFVATAAVSSALVGFMCLAMAGAGWFALGEDCPPFPWFLLKFFLFTGWVISLLVAIFQPKSSEPRS